MQGTDRLRCYNVCKGFLFYATHSNYSVVYKNAATQRHLLLGPCPRWTMDFQNKNPLSITKDEKRQKKIHYPILFDVSINGNGNFKKFKKQLVP